MTELEIHFDVTWERKQENWKVMASHTLIHLCTNHI
jgi:hypothetical protein